MNALIYLRVSTKEQAVKDETTEGYSIPAQREACLRHISERGWNLVDEFIDAGESARSADRPNLKSMLRRVAEGDVGAVVVHKIDRLARNIEDHVAIRAALRKHGCQLVSVTENIEETASGKLVEGIHALMAEFYSANLASEIKKGMSQKAKMGGVASARAYRLCQYETAHRRQGDCQGRARSRARLPCQRDVPPLRNRGLLDIRAAVGDCRQGPDFSRFKISQASRHQQDRRHARRSLLRRRGGVERSPVSGTTQASRLASSL